MSDTGNIYHSKTDGELVAAAGEHAIAQQHLAANAQEDSQHWHHVALAQLLEELAARLRLRQLRF